MERARRQKEEQVPKPSNEEGADTSKKMKGGETEAQGLRRKKGDDLQLERRCGTGLPDLCSRPLQGREDLGLLLLLLRLLFLQLMVT